MRLILKRMTIGIIKTPQRGYTLYIYIGKEYDILYNITTFRIFNLNIDLKYFKYDVDI